MRTLIRLLPGLLVLALSMGALSATACSSTSAQACKRTRGHRVRHTPPAAHVIPLKHVRAGEVASTLRRIGQGRRRAPYLVFTGVVRVTAYHHGNALLVTANPKDAAMLRRLVQQLDVPRRTLTDPRPASRAAR